MLRLKHCNRRWNILEKEYKEDFKGKRRKIEEEQDFIRYYIKLYFFHFQC